MSAPLDQLVGFSPSLEPLRARLERAAGSTASILIVGEPGTGRSTLARALHAASARRDDALVEFDATSVPASLFESELFGHERGAFTGAERARAGRVGRADEGTLLLDQIESLPTQVQPKLLRLIAEQRYAPLGGRERSCNIRFLAIGSHELPSRVREGRFREDLYYRLEVLAFPLAPLRERLEDLPAMVAVLLDDLCIRYGRGPVILREESLAWMRRYEWPGNLRELRNLLERAVVLHEGDEVSVEPPPASSVARPRSLVELERQGILDALRHTRGHQGRAAEILGISRKALWEKRKRLGIP